MNLFVADPYWGWWIIFYFSLGGVAAGAYFAAALIDLAGREQDRTLAPFGYRLAFPLILLCGVLLILDLDRPGRFWHMLLRSDTVEEAWSWTADSLPLLVQALHVKVWSPMSIGSWALMLFGVCSALSLLGSLWPVGRLAWLLRYSFLGRGLQVVGCGVGFFVAAYTGALLTATNQPVWSDSTWIAALFLTSAASTGLAAMILMVHWRGTLATDSMYRLERAEQWTLLLELVVFACFLVSLRGIIIAVVSTVHGALLVGGTLILGILLPQLLHLAKDPSRRRVLAAASLVLVGGFLMRYALLSIPPELLARASIASRVFQ